MIYNTQTFWSYLVNENPYIVNQVIELLTRKDYDFDTKETKISTYYQVVNKNQLQTVIRFPSGLIKYITDKLPIQVETAERYTKQYTEDDIRGAALLVKLQNNPNFEVRDYQIEAVLASLDKFTSLIQSTTGSGKTSILSLVCKVLVDKQILITNGNNFILQQIYERLQSFGITDVSWNQGKEPDYTKRIVLLNSSSSDSRLNRNDEAYINFLKKVQVWIIDEAAHFQSITNFEPIFYMDSEKLEHIIGYTATPFRNYKFPYDDPADFTLIALLGEPAFIYEMKDTINDENIAKPYSYFINFRNREAFLPPHLKDNYFMQYRANITYNKSRNAAGKAMVKYLNQHGIKTLVSFNNIKPAQKLMKELKEDGINALFICGNETIYEWILDKRGKLKLDTRRGTAQDIEIALETGGYNICFASQVFDEGVDINIFQASILFSAGKSPIKVLQVAGRAARKKKENNICFIIDFKDVDGCYIFRSQYEQRKELMKASGIINIDKVEDFCKMIEEISHSKS